MDGIHGPWRERKDVLVGTQNRTGPDYATGLQDKTHLQVMRGRLWRFWRASKARQKSLDLLWALGSHEKVSMEKQTEKNTAKEEDLPSDRGGGANRRLMLDSPAGDLAPAV